MAALAGRTVETDGANRRVANVKLRLAALPAWFWPALVIGAGAVLRVIPWLANYPLHRDEALYGAWARLLLSGRDPWLITVYVDKPPLVPYLLAGSLGAFGASEYALRLPGMLAGIAMLPVTFGLARRVAGRGPALLATALVAGSPFAILFGPTAFTDPWLALFLLAAAWAALAARPLAAGLCLGLALASKQTGILGLPLVVALLACARLPDGRSAAAGNGLKRWAIDVISFALGLLAVVVPVAWWDSLRWATKPGFWARSLETYGGLHLAAPEMLGARAGDWARQAGYLFGSPVLTLAIVAFAALAAGHAAGVLRREAVPTVPAKQGSCHNRRTGSAALLVLVLYAAGYLAVHVGLTFQPWDRYLLPLVPLVAILAAQGGQVVWSWAAGVRSSRALLRSVGVGGLAIGIAWAGWLGAAARLPIGSDHYAYAGLGQAAAAVRGLPWTAVVYERSLGWQLDFYMFDSPPPHIWWDSAETLADDAEYGVETYPKRQQWLVLATAVDGGVIPKARQALAGRGLDMVERRAITRPDGTVSFVFYQILPRASRAGDTDG